MTVFVDDRAGSGALVRYPPLDSIATLERLEFGDACFLGRGPSKRLLVGVEVKSIDDFLSSCLNGRLQATQLPGMLRTYQVSWVLLHGGVRRGKGGELVIHRTRKQRREEGKPEPPKLKIKISFRRDALDHGHDHTGAGGKRSTSTSYWNPYTFGTGGERALPFKYLEHRCSEIQAQGVGVWRCWDMAEAAAWLGDLYEWWQEPWEKHKGMHCFDESKPLPLMPKLDRSTKERAQVLSGLPALGFTRAVAAAEHFPDLAAAFAAGEKEWAEVPGVGKVIAAAVVRAIHKRSGVSG